MAEHPPACETWQPALAGWLVAQLLPHEEHALLAHLEGCSACRSEADRLFDVAAVSLGADLGAPLSASAVEHPPSDLGDRIVGRVRRERRARLASRAVVAVAAVAATVGLVAAVGRTEDEPPLRGQEVTFVRQAPGAEATAVVAPDGDGALIGLTATGLDPDTTYALWLTPPGGGYAERIAAGTFRPDADGRVEVRLRSALAAEETGRVWATTPEGEIALDTQAA